jgi:hypothetical protein
MSYARQHTLTAVLIVLSLAAAVLIFSKKNARAHSWYATDCCNIDDCYPVPAEAMEEIGPDIWRYKVTGNIFKNDMYFKRIRPSQDGGFHVCIGKASKTSLCAYIPVSM